MRNLIVLILLTLPAVAFADANRCEHSQARNLDLDLTGVSTVVFEMGANDIDLSGATGSAGAVRGQACASKPDILDKMTLTQEKVGATLTVRASRNGEDDSGLNFNMDFFGLRVTKYAYLKLKATVPEDMTVRLKVGSGDALARGLRELSVSAGSGDVDVRDIRGQLGASVGSGDLTASDIGSLNLSSAGSGDAAIQQVRGDSTVGSIGSGDLSIKNTQGRVEIGSVGSGDVELTNIGGDVALGSIGSGDASVRRVNGGLKVNSVGSGDIDHDGVTGKVDLPSRR